MSNLRAEVLFSFGRQVDRIVASGRVWRMAPLSASIRLAKLLKEIAAKACVTSFELIIVA